MSEKNPKYLSLLFPCYNPRKGWEIEFVNNIHSIQKQIPDYEIEVIICNDGSDQNFDSSICEYLKTNITGIKILKHNKNKGKGAGVRTCVKKATHPFTIYTDADFPFTIQSILRILFALEKGADLALGNRLNYSGQLSPSRKKISSLAMKLNRKILKLPYPDTQGGLKGFNLKGKEIFLKTRINGFLFDTEFIKIASKNQSVKINVVPIETREGVHFSNFNLKVLLRESLNFVKILFN
jgi:glycosyltransferase involved in cell wall biosynthesis